MQLAANPFGIRQRENPDVSSHSGGSDVPTTDNVENPVERNAVSPGNVADTQNVERTLHKKALP
ncbi:MAG: hypothetical protein ABR915_04180 [Thermoguttaceae bacterium]|jgi:hypothetical protein